MTFIPIPMEDEPLHTTESPFCPDPSCGCHEDQILIGEVAVQVESGLLTPQEATNIVSGKGI